MKRVGHIWETFCSIENATRAIYRGTENKRTDKAVVRIFGYDNGSARCGKLNPRKVDCYAKRIVAELEEGRWHHQPGRERTIQSSGKTRNIEIARLHDHIVQWMAMLAIEDMLIKRMYRHSCGNLPQRGIEDARKSVQKWARSGDCKYFVKLDIRHFYQSVPLDQLSAYMHSMIKDKRFLGVLDEIIYSAAEEDENGILRGLAIGFYSSPWFANTYLNPLDRLITGGLYKERRGKRMHYVRHYLRYVDDLLLMGNSKSDLKRAVKAVMAFCHDELGLEIKQCWEICRVGEMLPAGEKGKQKVKPGTKLIDIVGYTFSTTTTEVRDYGFLRTRRLAKRISKRLKERGVIFLQNAQALVSRCGWFDHADSKHFFATYIKPNIDLNFVKEVISYADKNRIVGNAARIHCDSRGDGSGYRILYGRC